MIQNDLNRLRSKEKCNISVSSELQPILWTSNSFTSSHDSTFDSDSHNLSLTGCTNHTEDDNIDWEFVTKQLETKLRTSIDMTQLPSNNTTPKLFQSTVTQQYSPNEKEIETSRSASSADVDRAVILHKLFNELLVCQQRQASLLEQIEQVINQSKEISSSVPSSLSFFLPLDSLTKTNQQIPSLQDAFQKRKSSFIQQSKERINQIHRHNTKYHHRIEPNVKTTNNTYLKEKRQSENDRLCAIIIKHQNRQNAKVYGNLIKNSVVS